MQTKTIHVLIDDNGKEVREGDSVLIQTEEVQEQTLAEMRRIMPNTAVIVIDDRVLGFRPMRIRVCDIRSLTLYAKKNKN